MYSVGPSCGSASSFVRGAGVFARGVLHGEDTLGGSGSKVNIDAIGSSGASGMRDIWNTELVLSLSLQLAQCHPCNELRCRDKSSEFVRATVLLNDCVNDAIILSD